MSHGRTGLIMATTTLLSDQVEGSYSYRRVSGGEEGLASMA
jgi:hypothetical protein